MMYIVIVSSNGIVNCSAFLSSVPGLGDWATTPKISQRLSTTDLKLSYFS